MVFVIKIQKIYNITAKRVKNNKELVFMALSIKNKKEFKNYVVKSLVERFNLNEDVAKDLVFQNRVIQDLENNPDKVMNFDAEFIAEKLVANSKLN